MREGEEEETSRLCGHLLPIAQSVKLGMQGEQSRPGLIVEGRKER